jgi:polyhydroxyalkanoate synthesis repressor PhaR
VRLIKKYKNRRLYDTSISKYITIEQMHQYVLNGESFKVEDSSSGLDITNETLLQILIETQSGKAPLLSGQLLQQLIIIANHPMKQSMQEALEEMFSSLVRVMEANPALKTYQKATQQWQEQTTALLKQWQEMFK